MAREFWLAVALAVICILALPPFEPAGDYGAIEIEPAHGGLEIDPNGVIEAES